MNNTTPVKIEASEPLTAGNFVNIYRPNDSNDFKVRKTNPILDRFAHGFVRSDCKQASLVNVHFEGECCIKDNAFTQDGSVFLSETIVGNVTISQHGYQCVGYMISQNKMFVSIRDRPFSYKDFYLLKSTKSDLYDLLCKGFINEKERVKDNQRWRNISSRYSIS